MFKGSNGPFGFNQKKKKHLIWSVFHQESDSNQRECNVPQHVLFATIISRTTGISFLAARVQSLFGMQLAFGQKYSLLFINLKEYITELIFKIIDSLHHDDYQRWAIWQWRNEKIWENFETPAMIFVSLAYQNLIEWKPVRTPSSKPVQHQQRIESWHPPPTGRLKCNIDALVFKEHNMYIWDAPLHNEWMGSLHGSYIYNNLTNGYPNPAELEAWSLLHALTWIKEQNLQNIDVEKNAKVIVETLYNNSSGNSDLQVLINKFKRILLSFPNLLVNYVLELVNHVARTLVRVSRLYASMFSINLLNIFFLLLWMKYHNCLP